MISWPARVFTILAVVLPLLLSPPACAQSGQYLVDGSNSLSALATQLQTKTGGVHKIRFKFYQNLGTFVLPGFTADSLIFERAEGSAEVVEASPYAPSRMKPSPYRMSSRIPCISPACVFPGARAHPLDTCIFAPPKDSGWWTE